MDNLIYIANARLPTEKAHGVQVTKMCEAFADCDVKVTLVIPRRVQPRGHSYNQSIYSYYRVKKNFRVKRIPCLDLLFLEPLLPFQTSLPYHLQNISFSISALFFALTMNKAFYTRDKLVALLLCLIRKHVIYEAHDSTRGNSLDRILANNASHIITICKSIHNSWKRLTPNVIYAPDGVASEFFTKVATPQARRRFKLPTNKHIVVYTGNFYPWKGVDTVIQAAKLLPRVHFYLVGGSQPDENIQPLIDKTTGQQNIHIMGHQPYQSMPVWLKAADVLVLPNSAKYAKSKTDTSPLKLFEYLASGTPVVASQVPAIEEIVTHNQVTFFTPDDHQSLSHTVQHVLKHQHTIKRRSTHAQKLARQHTWAKRARTIIASINHD